MSGPYTHRCPCTWSAKHCTTQKLLLLPDEMCRKGLRHRLKSCSICPLLPLLCPKKPALSLRKGVGFRAWQSCICRQTKGEQKAKQDATAKPNQGLSFVVFFKWNANRDLRRVLQSSKGFTVEVRIQLKQVKTIPFIGWEGNLMCYFWQCWGLNLTWQREEWKVRVLLRHEVGVIGPWVREEGWKGKKWRKRNRAQDWWGGQWLLFIHLGPPWQQKNKLNRKIEI